jgi:hypothetical protein
MFPLLEHHELHYLLQLQAKELEENELSQSCFLSLEVCEFKDSLCRPG